MIEYQNCNKEMKIKVSKQNLVIQTLKVSKKLNGNTDLKNLKFIFMIMITFIITINVITNLPVKVPIYNLTDDRQCKS